ncbi:MAG: glycosyltransferase [Bacteroidota bacterium]
MNEKRLVNVSIIAPNFNNGKYIKEFVQSVVESTVCPFELIIIDDGSTDDSIEVLDHYKNLDYLKIIRFIENRGLTAALNAGLDIASGKYIMRADPDDVLLPDRIEKQFQFMENHVEIDVVGCNVIYFNDKNGDNINNSNFPLEHAQIAAAFKRGEHGLQHPTTFVKGEVFRKYRYQKIFPGEDYELFARMLKDGCKFANLAEPFYLMRVHSGSSTTNLKIEDIKQTFKFRDQIFGVKTSKFWIYFYFQYIRHYRSFQMSENILFKYSHLLLSVMFYPTKLIKRLRKK